MNIDFIVDEWILGLPEKNKADVTYDQFQNLMHRLFQFAKKFELTQEQIIQLYFYTQETTSQNTNQNCIHSSQIKKLIQEIDSSLPDENENDKTQPPAKSLIEKIELVKECWNLEEFKQILTHDETQVFNQIYVQGLSPQQMIIRINNLINQGKEQNVIEEAIEMDFDQNFDQDNIFEQLVGLFQKVTLSLRDPNVQFIQSLLKKLEVQHHLMTQKIQESEQKMTQQNYQKQQVERENENFKKHQDQLMNDNEEMQDTLGEMSDQLEQLQQQFDNLQELYEREKSENISLSSEINFKLIQIDKQNIQLKQNTNEIKQLQNLNEILNNALHDMELNENDIHSDENIRKQAEKTESILRLQVKQLSEQNNLLQIENQQTLFDNNQLQKKFDEYQINTIQLKEELDKMKRDNIQFNRSAVETPQKGGRKSKKQLLEQIIQVKASLNKGRASKDMILFAKQLLMKQRKTAAKNIIILQKPQMDEGLESYESRQDAQSPEQDSSSQQSKVYTPAEAMDKVDIDNDTFIYDLANLRIQKSILNFIEKEKYLLMKHSMKIYSDRGTIFYPDQTTSNIYIMITAVTVYVIDFHFEMENEWSFSQLEVITFSKQSETQCQFSFKNPEYHLTIDLPSRQTMINLLTQNYTIQKLHPFQLRYTENLIFSEYNIFSRIKPKKSLYDQEPFCFGQFRLIPSNVILPQIDFKNTFFGALTSLGIIVFSSPGDCLPILFITLNGCRAKLNEVGQQIEICYLECGDVHIMEFDQLVDFQIWSSKIIGAIQYLPNVNRSNVEEMSKNEKIQ